MCSIYLLFNKEFVGQIFILVQCYSKWGSGWQPADCLFAHFEDRWLTAECKSAHHFLHWESLLMNKTELNQTVHLPILLIYILMQLLITHQHSEQSCSSIHENGVLRENQSDFQEMCLIFFVFKDLFVIFREWGRARETSMCGSLSHTSYQGPGLQPRHMPWLGIELETFWFTGQHSIHWATPLRDISLFIYSIKSKSAKRLVKIKNFYSTKDSVKRMKRQVTDWGKIFANHISDRGLMSRMYKEISKLKQYN